MRVENVCRQCPTAVSPNLLEVPYTICICPARKRVDAARHLSSFRTCAVFHDSTHSTIGQLALSSILGEQTFHLCEPNVVHLRRCRAPRVAQLGSSSDGGRRARPSRASGRRTRPNNSPIDKLVARTQVSRRLTSLIVCGVFLRVSSPDSLFLSRIRSWSIPPHDHQPHVGELVSSRKSNVSR
jgi:hypothetical protein